MAKFLNEQQKEVILGQLREQAAARQEEMQPIYDQWQKDYEIRREEMKDFFAPKTISPLGYVARSAAKGFSSGVAGVETAARGLDARKQAQTAQIMEQNKSKKTALGTFANEVFGAAANDLNSYQAVKGQPLRNMGELAATYGQATADILLGAAGFFKANGKHLENRAARNGTTVEEEAQKSVDRLTGTNRTADLLKIDQQTETLAEAAKDQNGITRAAGNIAGAAGGMVPATIVFLLTKSPKLARIVMSASAAGQKIDEALAQNATIEDAVQAGLVSGGIAYGTEMLFGGMKLFDEGTGLVSSAAKKLLPKSTVAELEKFGATTLGKATKKVLPKLGEGVEEAVEEALDPSVTRIYDQNADSATFKDLASAFGIGTAVSVLLGGFGGKKRTAQSVNSNENISDTYKVVSGTTSFQTWFARQQRNEKILFSLEQANTDPALMNQLVNQYTAEMRKNPLTQADLDELFSSYQRVIQQKTADAQRAATAGSTERIDPDNAVFRAAPEYVAPDYASAKGRTDIVNERPVRMQGRTENGYIVDNNGTVFVDPDTFQYANQAPGFLPQTAGQQNGMVWGGSYDMAPVYTAGDGIINPKQVVYGKNTGNIFVDQNGRASSDLDVLQNIPENQLMLPQAAGETNAPSAGTAEQQNILALPEARNAEIPDVNYSLDDYINDVLGGNADEETRNLVEQLVARANIAPEKGNIETQLRNALAESSQPQNQAAQQAQTANAEQVPMFRQEAPQTAENQQTATQQAAGQQQAQNLAENDTLAKNLVSMPQEESSFKDRVKAAVGAGKRFLINAADEIDKLDNGTGKHINRNNFNHVGNATRQAINSVGSKGDPGFQADLLGNRMGDSLFTIFDLINRQGQKVRQEFQDYLRHYHNIDRMKLNKPVFGQTETERAVTPEESAAKISAHESQHPEFKQAAEKVWQYNRNNLKLMVDGGIISQDAADKFAADYPHYVPTYRAGYKGGKLAQEATGGSSPMLPLDDMMALQTKNIFRQSALNKLGAGMQTTLNAESLNTAQTAADVESLIDESLTQDGMEKGVNKAGDRFTYFENGQKKTIAISKEIGKGLESLYPSDSDAARIAGSVGKVTNIFKQLVTTYSPAFTVNNTLRDYAGSLIYTKDLGRFVKNYPRAVRELAGNGKYAQQYKALGGFSNSYFDTQKGQFSADMNTSKARQTGKSLWDNTLGKIEAANEFIEQIPRLAEFISTIERTGDTSYDGLMNAMYDAADITINFGRAGSGGRYINKFVPFFNASLQGLDKAARTALETKTGKAWLKLAGTAVITGVGHQLINEMLYRDDRDYQELNLRDKANYFLFKTEDGKFIKIPKGRIQAVLSGITTAVVNDKKGETKDVLSLIAENAAPNSILEDNFFSMATRSKLFNPNEKGKTWNGSDIETEADQKKVPKERYDENTSRLMVKLGQMTGLSPKKLQDVFDTYGGAVADILISATTPAAERGYLESKFILDPVYSNSLSSDYYDLLDDNLKGGENSDMFVAAMNRYLKADSGDISDLYDKISEIQGSTLSDRKKQQMSRDVRQQINELYRKPINDAEKYADALTRLESTVDNTNKEDDVDELYRMANKEVYGAEYALKKYNKDIYEKAQKLNAQGIPYDEYYHYYFNTKDLDNEDKRRYIMYSMPNLADWQKEILDDEVINDITIIPNEKNVKYGSDEEFAISQLSNAGQEAWGRVQKYIPNMDYEDYVTLYPIISSNSGKKAEKLQKIQDTFNCDYATASLYWKVVNGSKGYK